MNFSEAFKITRELKQIQLYDHGGKFGYFIPTSLIGKFNESINDSEDITTTTPKPYCYILDPNNPELDIPLVYHSFVLSYSSEDILDTISS